MTELPALVTGRRADPLAANRLAHTLQPDFDAPPQRQPNTARILGVCTAEPATASDRALRRLAQWAEQSGPTGPVV